MFCSQPLMDTISVTSSPYLSTESNKKNEERTLPEKLALREKGTKIGQIFTVCLRDFFYLYVKLVRAYEKKILE